MLGGAAVPLAGLTVGWRWAFIGAVVFAAIASIPIPEGDTVRSAPSEPSVDLRRAALIILASSVMFLTAAANSASAFLVPSAAASGVEVGAAGVLLSVASVAGAVARLLAGWAKDRAAFDGLLAGAAFATVGALGLSAISTLPVSVALLIASVVAFVGAFGWSGLFVHAVARSHPNNVGRATGIAPSGIFVGGIVGPPLFGLLVAYAGYRAAWLLMAVASLIGAALMVIGRQMLVRAGDVERREPPRWQGAWLPRRWMHAPFSPGRDLGSPGSTIVQGPY